MSEFLIRFNKSRGQPGRGTVDHVWRVFEEDKEYLFKHVQIDTKSYSVQTNEDWNIGCKGSLTIDRKTSTAIISTEKYNLDYDITNYIVVIENCLPTELCDLIVNSYKNSNLWNKSALENNSVDDNIRNCESICLSDTSANGLFTGIDDILYAHASKAVNVYTTKFKNFSCSKDSGYDLLRYKVGGFYTEHSDSVARIPRALTCSFSLNDDYDGGEWAFFGGEKIFKIPKGAAVLFPSSFMFPHQVLPISSGERYSIVTWFI